MQIKGKTQKAKNRIGNHGNQWVSGWIALGAKNQDSSTEILLRSTKDDYLAWFSLDSIEIETKSVP